MDVWVRSEYAGEFAVLSAWISALLPWSVSYVRALGGGVLVVRFPFVQVQYHIGVALGDAVGVVGPLTALRLQRGTAAAAGYRLWVPGALILGLALALSVVYYRRESRLEAGRVHPVRAMGALLLCGSLVFGASWLLLLSKFPGLTLPVGVPLTLVLAGTLLVVNTD